jgi:hypothetical protein
MKKIENGLDQGKKLIIRFEDNYLSLESWSDTKTLEYLLYQRWQLRSEGIWAKT